MIRLIDAEALKTEINMTELIQWTHELGDSLRIDDVKIIIEYAPTVEAYTREELTSWLNLIIMENMDGVEEDKKFADHCAEILRRLDGFERFAKDKRAGKV